MKCNLRIFGKNNVLSINSLQDKCFSSVLLVLIMLFWSSCAEKKILPKSSLSNDNLTSGTIEISADESFQPVIDSELQVFLALNPDAHIKVHYKAEAECLKDLMYDSIRMVIVTRGLTEDETKFFKDTLGFPPVSGKMASDAIAVVVNNKAKDSMFSVSDIRGMLNGTSGYKYNLVMDGNRATSTVRFMLDSILKGQPLGSEIRAASSSEGVIDYVSNHKDAIGFVGVEWIGNKEDSSQLSFLKSVKIANMQCRGCAEEVYVKPYQANIVTRRYPLVRGLYYIVKENYGGLGKGFVRFLINQKGQLIFKRAYLAPSRMALQVRRMDMEDAQ